MQETTKATVSVKLDQDGGRTHEVFLQLSTRCNIYFAFMLSLDLTLIVANLSHLFLGNKLRTLT